MPVWARDRPGWGAPGSTALLERERELQLIGEVLASAQRGRGQALLLEGHPGMGKSCLQEAALHEARRNGLSVMRARGAELEHNLAFGVAGQLLRGLLDDLPATERRSLRASLPPRVKAILATGKMAADDLAELAAQTDVAAVSHGLFAALASAAGACPALIAIDDLHWCDMASLEFVLYVLQRLDELPAALVLTRRPGMGEAPSEVLDRVATHPRVMIEQLSPLGRAAVREVVQSALGGRAASGLVETCAEVTAGNPFYLHELLLAIVDEPDRGDEELVERARALAPDAVTRSLRVRVGRLGEPAAALARAVAILGDDVPLRHAAALGGLTLEQASSAAAGLANVEVLLDREPLGFVHPLVRHAVERDLPAFERASRHLDAARLLYADGFEVERVAAHILRGRAEGNPWAVGQLRAAAREARARGALHSAVRYTERALEEPPSCEERPEVLAELGAAEAAIGVPAAAEHLDQAASGSSDPRRRALLALQRGRALDGQGMHAEAARAYEHGLRELSPHGNGSEERELRDQLQADFVATAGMVPDLQERSLELSEQLLGRAVEGPRTQGQRLQLAQAALQAAYAGEAAGEVSERAERAWDHGRLLEHGTPQGIGWRLVSGAFCLAGKLERSVEVADAALEEARRRGWPLAFATASYARALPHLWQGRVDDALADLEAALDARRYGWRQFVRLAHAHYALSLIEKGTLEQAEKVLSEEAPIETPQDLEDVLRMYSLAELRLAQERPREALEVALAAGAIAERRMKFFGYSPWRTCAAQAALALGQHERALKLATEAADRAKRTKVLHQRIRTLWVLASCQEPARRLETLQAAVDIAADEPPRLETIRGLVALGSSLRRANQRAEAREPLQAAAGLAHRGGALALYERARTELAATGARPRRDALLSGPASLTPSERRIAHLAAGGQSNRQIAQALFVTPKTVEYHLRNVYRKLGIDTREELGRALAA